MPTLRLGTRSSPLALWQAEYVRDAIQRRSPDVRVDLVHIKTEGDKLLTASLARIGGKGVFVKEIEEALLDGRIDCAVHSAKDLPTTLPAGLAVTAVPERADPHDVLVTREPLAFGALPEGALLATGSLRRRAQLLHVRQDLRFTEFRGNLETRHRKFLESDAAGLVLAAAGIGRLGWSDRPSTLLAYEACLPAVGQAALAVESRTGDSTVTAALAPLHHGPTAAAVTAERAFLAALGGGCQAPIGALGRVADDRLTLEGAVLTLDGVQRIHGTQTGQSGDAAGIGAALAENLLNQGAAEIVSALEENNKG